MDCSGKVDSDDGEDTYRGGVGSDTYVVPTWTDSSDWVQADYYSPSVTVDLAKGLVRYDGFIWDHLESVENISTGEGNDNVRGNNEANVISVGGGLNDVSALGGDDKIYGGYVYNELGEGESFVLERLDGGSGNDTINSGDSYWEFPTARSYNRGMATDVMYGRAGDDLLIGGEGNFVMNGGSGADRFDARADLFEIRDYMIGVIDADVGSVVITDFDAGEGDRIILRTGINYDSFDFGERKADIPDFIGQSAKVDFDEVGYKTVRGNDGGTDTVITYRYLYQNDYSSGRGRTRPHQDARLQDCARRLLGQNLGGLDHAGLDWTRRHALHL